MDQPDHVVHVSGRPVAKAHSHTTQTQCRYLETAFSQFTFFHGFPPFSVSRVQYKNVEKCSEDTFLLHSCPILSFTGGRIV